MKKQLLILALFAALALPAFAQAVIDLSDSLGANEAISLSQASGTNTWALGGTGTVSLAGANIYNGANGSVMSIDPDPQINFGFGITNTTGSTQSYSITFPLTYGPLGFPTGSSPLAVTLPTGTYTVTSSLGVTLSESDTNGVTFSQNGNLPFQQDFINQGDPDQVNVAAIGAGAFTIPSGPVPDQTVDFPAIAEYSNNDFVLSTTGTTMSVTVSFDLSADDSASFSGSYTINAVPEPASVLLGVVAFTVLAAIRARVKRA